MADSRRPFAVRWAERIEKLTASGPADLELRLNCAHDGALLIEGEEEWVLKCPECTTSVQLSVLPAEGEEENG